MLLLKKEISSKDTSPDLKQIVKNYYESIKQQDSIEKSIAEIRKKIVARTGYGQ